MAQVDSENSTVTPYRTPLRSHLIEATAIVFLLSGAAVAGCLIAKNLDHQIAACAQAKSSMVLR